MRRRKRRSTPHHGAMLAVLVAIAVPTLGLISLNGAPDAQVAAAAAGGTTEKDCEQAKTIAAAGISHGAINAPLRDRAGNKRNFDDTCYTAVFDPSKAQKGEKDPKKNPKNYKCVGKSSKVSMQGGNVNEVWNTNSKLPGGSCSVEFCTAKGCQPAELMAGVHSSTNSILDPDLLNYVPQSLRKDGPDWVNPLRPDPGLQLLPSPNGPAMQYGPIYLDPIPNDLVYHVPDTGMDNAMVFNPGSLSTANGAIQQEAGFGPATSQEMNDQLVSKAQTFTPAEQFKNDQFVQYSNGGGVTGSIPKGDTFDDRFNPAYTFTAPQGNPLLPPPQTPWQKFWSFFGL